MLASTMSAVVIQVGNEVNWNTTERDIDVEKVSLGDAKHWGNILNIAIFNFMEKV